MLATHLQVGVLLPELTKLFEKLATEIAFASLTKVLPYPLAQLSRVEALMTNTELCVYLRT